MALASSSMIKVEIHCKKLVKPANPTPSHLQKLMLSSIDQLQPPNYYVAVNFHFDLINNRRDRPLIISRLEQSLSEILTLYYPFAGRYNADDSTAVVLCLDQGVEFATATVDVNLNQLVDGEFNPDILVSAQSKFPASGIAQNPLILIQVNTFKCGGLVIGLCFFHKIGDMFTMSKFMDDWAKACRSGTLDNVVRPNFDLSSLLPPKDNFVDHTPPPCCKGHAPPRFVMRRVIFSGEAIKKLKTATSNHNVCNYTRVELVTALISSTIINMDHLKFGRVRSFLIAHMMSLRKKTLLLAGKENSCGNLFTVVMATKDQMVNGCLELKELASLIHGSITSCTAEMAKLREGTELSLNVENAVRAHYKEIAKGEDVHAILFSSWFRFPLYEVDFGWGRPSLVSLLPVPFIYVGFVDNKNDAGGIEAWVSLEEADMAHFCRDKDILTYTSLGRDFRW